MDKITMLGTGHAMTFGCFNTCFIYENENGRMLVDTGGGNQLLLQMQKAGFNTGDFSAVFISHRHTDHMMGLPWIFRSVGGPGSNRILTMYLHEDVYTVAQGLIDLLFPDKKEDILRVVRFVQIKHGDEVEILGRKVCFLDLNSPNVPQFGFSMVLGNGKRFTFHGDVPFDEANRDALTGTEYLMHEAFNLASEKIGMPPMGAPGGPGGMPPMPGGPGGPPLMPGGGKEKGPGKMGHSTVEQAAGYAQSLQVDTLILVHGNDNDLPHRKEKYVEEASKKFFGKIYAPYDLDEIILD